MKYMLICTSCGQKHFTNGSDIKDLTEVKTAPLPKNANGIDKTNYDLPKKIKCYNCGMVFKIVKLPQPKVEVKEEDFEMKEDKPLLSGDDYFKQWENEALRSARKKKSP